MGAAVSLRRNVNGIIFSEAGVRREGLKYREKSDFF